MNLRPLLLTSTVSVLLAVAAAQAAGGEDVPPPAAGGEAASALRFRRVYAPADRVEQWPLGNAKYPRMEPAEFERLLKIAHGSSAGFPSVRPDDVSPNGRALPAARAVTAQYHARLVGERSISGKCTMQVARHAETPTLLPLQPCGLAIGEATWAPQQSKPAMLGLGADGRLQVLVEDSGQLDFDWSLAGQRDAEDAINFQFELPACPANRLVLELPADLTPATDHGLLPESDWIDETLRRWTLELGGHHRFRLRLFRANPAGPPRQLSLVQESVEHHFSERGLSVMAELKFEIYSGPLRQITLALDRPLQLLSAQCGGTPVPWSPAPPNGSMDRIVLMLPEPVHGTQCVLQLRALAPLTVDRRWQLPRIRPEEVFWQEGTVALLVPAPLLLQRLVPIGCRQTGAGPLPGSQPGESVQFQCFAPDATVEVVLSRRRTPLQLASGTAIELSERGMTARVVADFSVGGDPQFLLEADVSKRWLIDSVESYPPEAMDDWEPERPARPFEKDVASPPDGRLRPEDGPPMGSRRRMLSVSLAKSLSPTRPVRLVVNLHAPTGRKLGIDELVPVRFAAAEVGRPLVAVRAVGPFQLRLTGAERLKRVDPQALDVAERARFAELPQDLLFENDPDAAELGISLESRTPGYAAMLRAEAVVGEETLRESYTVRCVPESARVDRVVVLFSHRRDVPPRWTLGAEGGQQLSARPLAAAEQAAAGVGPGQEAWELTLRRPRSEPFEIRGTREVRRDDQQPISLVSLPEATSQRATLVVRSPGWQGLRIVNHRLTPIPTETISLGGYETARATYRYDPLQEVGASADAAVTVSRSGDPTTPPAWVWSCHLESRYEARGTGRHLATYRLQNSGGGKLELELPSGVKSQSVHEVRINKARVAPHRLTGKSAGRLAIDLPPGEKFPCVSILFSTPAARLGSIGSLRAPLPKTDLKVFTQEWTVWLPPGFDAYGSDLPRQPSATSRPSWTQRLFGPLGRSAGQRAFDPRAAFGRLFAAGETPEAPPPPVETQQGQAARPRAPWAEARLAGGLASDPRGWNTYCLNVLGPPAARLKYVHRQTIRLWGSVVFLLVIALGWWVASERLELLTALAVAFGCAALLLPEAFAPLASGGVLGALFCLVYRLIRSRGPARGLPAGSTADSDPPGAVPSVGRQNAPPSGRTATLVGILAFVAAAVAAVCSVGGGEPPQPTPTLRPVHRVFIPVGQDGQPTGEKYFVPEELFEQLHRLDVAATEKPQGWFIKRADYRGVLSRETASQRIVVEQLKASFSLELFDSATRVRIPLGREGANLLPDGALLDSRVIQPEWEADGEGLLLDVPGPGEYNLELSLRPTVRTDGATAVVDLSIPPLARSRLELSVPPGAPPVEVPSAVGLTRFENQPPRMVAELGPSNRLTVRWPQSAGRTTNSATPDVEELLWMKVQPGSVVVDAKLKFKIAQGQLRQVRLAADGRLRLRPLEGDNPPAVEVRRVAGQPQILVFRWPKPVADEVVLVARFDLTETWGVGNLRLPQLNTLDARSSRRWLAVSVDAALEHEGQVPAGQEAVAVPDFLSSWGESASQPQFAYRLPAGETTWGMSTRLREPRTSVEQKLALSIDRESAAVQFDAQLSPAAGYVFQHRLRAPADLKVDDVSVLQEGVPQIARWAQDDQGTVTVFLTELMAGPQKLSLRASLPIRGKMTPLPVLQIDSGELQSSTIELFRRPAVLVKLDQADGLVPLEDLATGAYDPQWGRPAGRFRARGEGPSRATLVLTPNRPKVQAEQVTRLRCEGGAWTAQIDGRLHVSDGVLDQIQIEVAGPLSDACQVSPQAELKLLQPPGQSRQLIVRPPAAIEDDYPFSISCPLTLAPGQRPSAPRVLLRQVAQLRRFLVLPRQAEGQPIDWQTQGLRAMPLPDGLATPPDAEALLTYEIVGNAYQAVLGQDRSRQYARVRLADVQLAWQPDRSCVGVAVFDLEPGRLSECRLWLPSGYRLLHVSVAGVPSQPVPSQPVSTHTNAWRVPLGPARLPQRIEVLFSGSLPPWASGLGQIFEAPTLGRLPVERTLWTIVGPSMFGQGRPDDDNLVSTLPHGLFRLTSAATMIESASTVPAEDPDETLRWYRRWAGRFAAARTALQLQPGSGSPATKVREEIDAIDARQSQIAERLGVTDEYQRLKRSATSAASRPSAGQDPYLTDEMAEVWQASLGSPLACTQCMVPQRSGSITLSYRRAEPPGLPYRLAGAAGLLAVAVLVLAGLRRGTLAECFKRWPHPIGVAIGLAWWLWLSPSILGWAIVLVSLAAALRSGWKHAPPSPGSAIISLETRQR